MLPGREHKGGSADGDEKRGYWVRHQVRECEGLAREGSRVAQLPHCSFSANDERLCTLGVEDTHIDTHTHVWPFEEQQSPKEERIKRETERHKRR
jgi:hypothetical protein